MAWSISSPPATPSKITILGSGTYTTGATTDWEEAGSFSTAGAVGNGIIVFEACVIETGAGNAYVGLHPNLGTSASPASSAITSQRLFIAHFRAPPPGGTNANLSVFDVVSWNNTDVGFDLTAAETFYVKAKNSVGSGGGATTSISWIAYLISE